MFLTITSVPLLSSGKWPPLSVVALTAFFFVLTLEVAAGTLVPPCGRGVELCCGLWISLCDTDLLCRAESQESELSGSSPSEQEREQKMSPPRGRKGLPSRGSRQQAQLKHASEACQCWPSYVIWPWSIPADREREREESPSIMKRLNQEPRHFSVIAQLFTAIIKKECTVSLAIKSNDFRNVFMLTHLQASKWIN